MQTKSIPSTGRSNAILFLERFVFSATDAEKRKYAPANSISITEINIARL